jgi:hypothetical protein
VGLLASIFGKRESPVVIDVNGPGEFLVPIVGESRYLNAFEQLFGERDGSGIDRVVVATLHAEPTNPHDRNAVRVEIAGLTVGYLERESAENLTSSLARSANPNAVLRVRCRVRGGWYRDENDHGHFGAWLDFPSATLRKR